MELKRGIDKAVSAVVEELKKLSKPVKGKKIAQVGTISANDDETIGKIIAEAMEKVGKDGVITVEEAKTPRDHARGRRGHAVRPRLPLARTSSPTRSAWKSALEDPLHPDPREEDLEHEGPAPAARAGRRAGQAAADHRRGRRGRGAGHAGGQQAARHAAGGAVKAPGLRRPPQGHARGHRHPHRRQGHHRGPRHQARERQARGPGPRQEDHHRQGQHHDRRGRRQAPRTSRAASSRSAPRSRRPPPTTTARSSRSAWPSWWAAWP